MRYPVEEYVRHSYVFYSEGPKGRIKMGVKYKHLRGDFYLLSFGQLSKNLRVDDQQRVNNNDRDKILATVASTILDFTDKVPEAHIYFEGSTMGRSRLYQMGINKHLLEVNKRFRVQGFIEGHWENFKPGTNYEAFMIQRKINS